MGMLNTIDAKNDVLYLPMLSSLFFPSASEVPSSAIRVGSRRIVLAAKDLRRVAERFSIITEQNLIRPNTFTLADFEDFLRGVPNVFDQRQFGVAFRLLEFFGELWIAPRLVSNGRRRAADILRSHILAASDAQQRADFPAFCFVKHRRSAAFSHEEAPKEGLGARG